MLSPPSSRTLLRELAVDIEPAALDDVARRLAIAELNQRLSDVSFELEVMPSTFAALVRICLASGSALALVGFLVAPEAPVTLRAVRLVAAAAAGLCGAIVVAVVGRSAKNDARKIRENWDAASRDIGKALGTTLAASEARINSR